MSGRPTADRGRAWADEVNAVGDRIGRHFARSEPRRRAVGYVRGLLIHEPGTAVSFGGFPLGPSLDDAFDLVADGLEVAEAGPE